MTNAIAFARPLQRLLMPVMGMLLITLLFVGGAHHHSDGGHHACAVCTVGHSPAVTASVTAPTGVPDRSSQAVCAPLPHAPRPARFETAPSRAPPLA